MAVSLHLFANVLLVGSVWLLFLFFTDISTKIRSLVIASLFSLIEFTFYATTTEIEFGDIAFTPFAATCRNGHTTFAQWWVNVLFSPFLHYYFMLDSMWVKIVFFPFCVWALEIVEGYFLIAVYGSNVAWVYETNDALFHGNIRIGFWKYWLALGAVAVHVYPYLITLSHFTDYTHAIVYLVFPTVIAANILNRLI